MKAESLAALWISGDQSNATIVFGPWEVSEGTSSKNLFFPVQVNSTGEKELREGKGREGGKGGKGGKRGKGDEGKGVEGKEDEEGEAGR